MPWPKPSDNDYNPYFQSPLAIQ